MSVPKKTAVYTFMHVSTGFGYAVFIFFLSARTESHTVTKLNK
jgi:hypothetical protein